MDNLNYGVVGNCRSAALISSTGSLDWLCLPDFSSSTCFAALLDKEHGGRFAFECHPGTKISQDYVDHTNIISTCFKTPTGEFEVLDFMPRYKNDQLHYIWPPDLIRYVRHISGSPKVKFIYQPALGYAEHRTYSEDRGNYIKSWSNGGKYESIYLYTDASYDKVLSGEETVIDRNCFFLVSYNQKLLHLDLEIINLEFERTKVYWMDWVHRTVCFARYREEILRSALTLKMLSYQKSGAILAAITTSVPESIGEVRNWDYRFCWIRDASMIIRVLTQIGHYQAAKRYLQFILDIIPRKDEKIQIMYGIRGEKKLPEKELPWLSGYADSKPVRIGNAAYLQKQNDIYGVLMDVLYESFTLFRNDLEQGEDLWTAARTLIRIVENNWRKPDMGLWEYRTKKRNFVFSKVLCWVALDRGVKMAQFLNKNEYIESWSAVRDEIHQDIMEKGWNSRLNSFTQAYENEDMDAANLLLANYGFISPSDPKYISTVDLIQEKLCRNGLLYRYRNEDDFGKPASAFTVCSFWLVKSLCMIGRKKEARQMFSTLLGHANYLGLFSEDLDFDTKRLLGNFPQGYSHLALIDVAIDLSDTELERDEQIISRIEQYGK